MPNRVIIATGGSSGGYAPISTKESLSTNINFFTRDYFKVASNQPLSPGGHVIVLDYRQKPFARFKDVTGGSATLSVDGVKVAEGGIGAVFPGRFSATETLDIGKDLGSTVSRAYAGKAPYAFTGIIESVTVELND